MAKGKKYDFRVEQAGDVWTVDIIRQVTSKKTTVSKTQSGFATESEAKTWGETELKTFLEHLTARNKRRRSQRD